MTENKTALNIDFPLFNKRYSNMGDIKSKRRVVVCIFFLNRTITAFII